MTVPMDHNNQDNYDSYMSEVNDPSNHEIDNIPSPQEDHWGTELGTPQPQVKKTTGNQQPKNDQRTVGADALQRLKDHMESGHTKTKGKGKR